MKYKMNNIYNEDNLPAMKQMPDNYFELAIIDPPYGILKKQGGRIDSEFKSNDWDIAPSDEYFKELFRISKNQIIWGGNNFTLPKTEYFIIWDKHQTVDNFASAEYAWTNYKMPAKVFRYSIHKCMSERKKNGGKIHPTQKPVALYEWLLKNYAKKGDKILDTHLGSGSSIIACKKLGFDYMAFELDKDYYEATMKRIKKFDSQGNFFDLFD